MGFRNETPTKPEKVNANVIDPTLKMVDRWAMREMITEVRIPAPLPA